MIRDGEVYRTAALIAVSPEHEAFVRKRSFVPNPEGSIVERAAFVFKHTAHDINAGIAQQIEAASEVQRIRIERADDDALDARCQNPIDARRRAALC